MKEIEYCTGYCTRCKTEKTLDQFYLYGSGKRFGTICKPCKECQKVRSKKRYDDGLMTPNYKYQEKWRKTTRGRMLKNLSNKVSTARYPEKDKARSLAKYALKKGEIAVLPCEVCGSTEKVQMHHEDYSNPLEVIWLCIKHHKEVHYGKRS